MIIETIVCKKITRELTDLMRSYNITILTVESGDYDQLIVSYRADRIFEATQFKELSSMLDSVILLSVLRWDNVLFEYRDLFTEGKDYNILGFIKPDNTMVEIINDNGVTHLVSVNSSVYGENRIFFHGQK